MVFTFTEPILNAVPPIELMNPLSLEVSERSLQQLLKVVTSPLTKKLESFHLQL